MTEEIRFDYELDEIWGSEGITETIYVFDNEDDNWKFYVNSEVKADKLCKKLNEQQATIDEYEDFCYNLCMFILGKDLDEEYRENYAKEYNIITKWNGRVKE